MRQRHSGTSTRRLVLETLEDRSLLAAVASDGRRLGAPVATPAALIDDSFEENDSRLAARNLGTLTASATFNNLVMADAADWYRFSTTLTGTSSDNVRITFLHAQGDVDMELYNASGIRLRYSNGVTNAEQISLSGLAAGTYYVRVYGYLGVFNPSYSLTINPPRAGAADDAYENNDTLGTARDLGTLAAAQTISNLVMADSHDWYRFSMSGPGAAGDLVAINFQQTQGDLQLELYSSGGAPLGSSLGTASGESISLAGLAAGTYYVHVFGAGGALNPNYSLTIDPGTAAAPPPPPPGTGGFDIQFSFSGLTASQQSIFEQAAQRWESIIVGDLPNASYNFLPVDDLLIGASSVFIDGSGGVLGQAGYDRLRSATAGGLPYHGIMQFDSADLASMQANGTLLGVIAHEIGHVLGIGTLWSNRGLLVGASTSNPIFVGPQATAEYNALFGTTAAGVPVENTGGSGTRNSHWRESIFRNEIMTGWVGPGTSLPISRMTVASLAD
ncbi:MAG TPA: pre-peptidase C-terminal domain-containing protein, partial [Pirellulaceae bacterium]|nr:pre-peptidase C-terminal domain-containing protein [Pirellulaceae bacterium]